MTRAIAKAVRLVEAELARPEADQVFVSAAMGRHILGVLRDMEQAAAKGAPLPKSAEGMGRAVVENLPYDSAVAKAVLAALARFPGA